LATAADLEMQLGRNGYAGLSGVEDGRVNVCGLFRLDRGLRGPVKELLPAYLRAGGLGELAGRIEAGGIDESSCCAVAGFVLGGQPRRPGLFTIGDAERMIPPFTGNGMSMAIEAAEMAVDPLLGWSRGELRWDDCRAQLANGLERRFARRLRAAEWLHPLLTTPCGRRLLAGLGWARLLPFKRLVGWVR